jgi:hypothetical protein
MATTTNYSFPTPDDTDLVKDGASAIRSFGTAVDTQIKNLNPGTTAGDIDYYTTSSTKARIAIGTAGQVLKVNAGATAPEWATDASGMTNPMTTTADLIYSSSGSTPARLGIGTAGQVLQVNSGATAPEWATPASGGMTLISSTALTGASVTLSSIPQTYKNLQLLVTDFVPSTDARSCVVRFNGDTGSNYNSGRMGETNAGFGASSIILIQNNDDGGDKSIGVIDIYDYTNSISWKMGFGKGLSQNATTPTNFNSYAGMAMWNNTSNITSITLTTSGGNFNTGDAYLYGVK